MRRIYRDQFVSCESCASSFFTVYNKTDKNKYKKMSSTEYLDKAKALIKEHPYLMLSKSWCPDCHYTYKIWDEYNVKDKVHVIEFDKFPDQEEAKNLEKAFIEISGLNWVPTIFFNGKRLGTEADLKEWKKEGKLDQVFKDEKLI